VSSKSLSFPIISIGMDPNEKWFSAQPAISSKYTRLIEFGISVFLPVITMLLEIVRKLVSI
jgi:hypothetical protein